MWELAEGVHEGAQVEWQQGAEVYHGRLLRVRAEGWGTVEEPSGQLVAVPVAMLRPWAPAGQLRLL